MPYPPNINVAASPLAPIPASYTMASDESRNMPFDFSPNLNPGETLSSATSTLTDRSVGRGQAVTIPGPTVATTVVNQTLSGSVLAVGHVYWLRIKATTSLGNVWTSILTVFCPA